MGAYASGMNADTAFAWRYHEATKHTPLSVRSGTHALDWDNRPLPFKVYRGLERVALPRRLRGSDVPLFQAVAAHADPTPPRVPDLADLAQVLYLSAGITRRKAYYGTGEEALFRAAACTGALYEIELYVVCGELPGLAAGVYHFDPRELALERLRAGDHRRRLLEATAGEPAITLAPAVVVCTGTYWRNAWKYQARTYRHFGWDNGTVLANLLSTAAALSLPARVVCGFVDAAVNELLALDTRREVSFSLLALGGGEASPPDPPPLQPLSLEVLPVSDSETDYPLMRETHQASSLLDPQEVAAWRGGPPLPSPPPPSGETLPLRPPSAEALPRDSNEDVILRRGSTRRFSRTASIGFDQLSALLQRSTQGIPADFLQAGGLMSRLYVVAHAVEGLEPGSYVLHRQPWVLQRLRGGLFRDKAGYLGLEQALPAEASAVVFFLADLRAVLERFGNRGYRLLQLEAGILGGKLYLSAYALRLGASGLTFYDEEVVRFFSPHAEGLSAVFVITLGRSAPVLPVGRAEPYVPVSFAPSSGA